MICSTANAMRTAADPKNKVERQLAVTSSAIDEGRLTSSLLVGVGDLVGGRAGGGESEVSDETGDEGTGGFEQGPPDEHPASAEDVEKSESREGCRARGDGRRGRR